MENKEVSTHFVVLGLSGKHEDKDTEVLYCGPREEAAFSLYCDEYTHTIVIEKWLESVGKVKSWIRGDGSLEVSFDLEDELVNKIEKDKNSLEELQNKLRHLKQFG